MLWAICLIVMLRHYGSDSAEVKTVRPSRKKNTVSPVKKSALTPWQLQVSKKHASCLRGTPVAIPGDNSYYSGVPWHVLNLNRIVPDVHACWNRFLTAIKHPKMLKNGFLLDLNTKKNPKTHFGFLNNRHSPCTDTAKIIAAETVCHRSSTRLKNRTACDKDKKTPHHILSRGPRATQIYFWDSVDRRGSYFSMSRFLNFTFAQGVKVSGCQGVGSRMFFAAGSRGVLLKPAVSVPKLHTFGVETGAQAAII